MTTPEERTRSLRWAWDLLGALQTRSEVPSVVRDRAREIARSFPSSVVVRAWVTADVSSLPEDAAYAIEAAAVLFADLQARGDMAEDLRHELLYVRRHLPLPGRAVDAARHDFMFGVDAWLGLE